MDDLNNCEIKSPINGVIGINNFAVGNYVTPASGAMATINQITPIRVEFAMSNRDFLEMFGTEENLKKEAKVRLVLANDKEFSETGVVEFIDNNVNRRTDTIQVFANFPNKLGQLRPGSSVTVKIERKIANNVPALLPSAVMPANGNKFYVYVVDEKNMVQKREIKVSTQRSDYVFVSEGLKEGETVVVDGTHKIRIMKPGTPFPVVPAAPAPTGK
jgi:RND family efflux transporter MFP subunit